MLAQTVAPVYLTIGLGFTLGPFSVKQLCFEHKESFFKFRSVIFSLLCSFIAFVFVGSGMENF